ncbi:MAG: glycosyltransferase [Sedimentisphaerales bacterium]|nr:glycosyltransferase [Sedimentisphaerales bacterium]
MSKKYERVPKHIEGSFGSHKKAEPVVSVLITTFNRRRYFAEALASIICQNYRNLQIIVVNDGGEDVSDIVNSYNDRRILFINRKENRGQPYSLNEAIAQSHGKYICYLGDDDLYYPHHVSTLVDALENQTDCQVAYSDLYKVYCQVCSDGSRKVLSKVVEISRDFDRFFMLYYNHVLHVSLMHRRDLLEKTGLYNEDTIILRDWDMTRRLVFFSDFYHVPEITGEFYQPAGKCDRISVLGRKDEKKYARNILTIRTTRPAKPWTKLKDMSIIFTTERLNKQAGTTLGSIWQRTFYPYEVYLPLPAESLDKLESEMPNIIPVPVNPMSSQEQRIDTALARCDGEYIAIVPNGFPMREFWIEDSLHALNNSSANNEGFELEDSTDRLWAVVLKKEDLQYARRSFPNLPVRESLNAASITIRHLKPEEIPFQFDQLLEKARNAEKIGNWSKAAEMFEYIATHHQNELWMKSLAANASFQAGSHIRAANLSHEINGQRPTVDTLLLEAKIKREQKDYNLAIKLLEKAEQILEGKNLLWI